VGRDSKSPHARARQGGGRNPTRARAERAPGRGGARQAGAGPGAQPLVARLGDSEHGDLKRYVRRPQKGYSPPCLFLKIRPPKQLLKKRGSTDGPGAQRRVKKHCLWATYEHSSNS
jgi:hypothetical protein